MPLAFRRHVGGGFPPRMRILTLNTPERPENLGIKEWDHSHDDDGSQRRLGDVVEERGQEVQRQQHQHTCGEGSSGGRVPTGHPQKYAA